jgi:hypothetical protein
MPISAASNIFSDPTTTITALRAVPTSSPCYRPERTTVLRGVQLLWVRHFATVEELRQALAAFAAKYNASWLRQRHGYKTPNQIRAEQKALETEAATGFKMAA